MLARRWQQRAAKAVLVTFGTTFLACGGTKEEAPPTTTLAPTTTVAPPAPPPTLPAQPPEQLSAEQLRELVAPVALYPDVVLASLLPATTYPQEVDDAARWVAQQHGDVQAVPPDKSWDGSVAGLLQFPDVLTWLADNDPWAEQMGTAVTYQQGDVLQAIQDYRHQVADAGNLKSNQYQKVTTQPNDDITIAPAQPETVYVPQYDPVAATQPQPATQGINPWLAFGGGAVVGALGAWALYSIFDDDDHHGGGGHKKVIKTYNNYYYGGGGGQRPPASQWQPRPVPYGGKRPGKTEQIVRPTRLEDRYGKERRPGHGGVRPPAERPQALPGVQPRTVEGKQGQRKKGSKPTPAPGLREQGLKQATPKEQAKPKKQLKPQAERGDKQQKPKKQQNQQNQQNQQKKKKKKG